MSSALNIYACTWWKSSDFSLAAIRVIVMEIYAFIFIADMHSEVIKDIVTTQVSCTRVLDQQYPHDKESLFEVDRDLEKTTWQLNIGDFVAS